MQIPKDLIEKANDKLSRVANSAEFYQVRSAFLGKSSQLTQLFGSLRDLPKEDKIKFAKELNTIKSELEEIFERAFDSLGSSNQSSANLDLTLPGIDHGLGTLHPISVITQKITSYFEQNHYSVFFGNEIESDFFNFEALNFPANHPARQMHDTFYLDDEQKYLMRTHTSNTQIHRPSYFPFTEPSAEVDIRFGKKGWLEVLGCGMVHPNVLNGCGVDPNQFTGFAFGMGIERLAMLYYGVEDIRDFYSSNLEFLKQFNTSL
jgi:phenylalanyl-tRNA synthetase alpha subunit